MRVRLGTDSWTGASQNVSSQWQVFQSLAPAVSALSGSVANIPTAGTTWPNVGVVQVKYMQVRSGLLGVCSELSTVNVVLAECFCHSRLGQWC